MFSRPGSGTATEIHYGFRSAIAKLRRAFRDNARHPHVIETVPKSGYRLIAEVKTGATVASEHKLPPTVPTGRRADVPWLLAVAAVLLLALFRWLLRDPPAAIDDTPSPAKLTVAVLPFTNIGASPEHDYFANGLTSDLITDLSKVQRLRVIAPGTGFAYRGNPAAMREAFGELSVDHVVLGTVQRAA